MAQYFTQQNSYHVVMEILPELQGEVDSLDKIYISSPTTGEQVPLAAFAKWTTRRSQPLSISHQGQFPAVTISFNLAQGVSLGTATEAIQQAEREMRHAGHADRHLPGQRAGLPGNRCSTVPMLILAALFVVYLILGILYESYIHPLTILSTLPSAGAGALATLMLFGFDFSLVAMIGVILLIGIVKKNGIMMVDFAITAERDEHLSPEQGDPQGGAAALPPDHDDDDGGAARRRAADAGHRHRARKSASRSATRWSAGCSSARR